MPRISPRRRDQRHVPHPFLALAAAPEPDPVPEHMDTQLLFDDGSRWTAPREAPRLREEPRQ